MSSVCASRVFGHHFRAAAAAAIPAFLKDFANVRDNLKRGPVHHAAADGFTDACKYFLKDLKLDVNEKDDLNKTPLIYAAEHGHTATAKFLVDYGAALEFERGRYPLLYAAKKGDIELMKSLLSKGAKADFVNRDFSTSLSQAALSGQPDACRLLLENGANPNGHPDYPSFSPIGLAIRSCSLPCVQVLVEANATLNSPATSWEGNPLHQAAYFGHQEIVKYLLENGADPNIKCVTRFSDDDVWKPRKPIQVAAQYGKVGVVKVLFPHTTPIKGYTEWSIDRILGDMQPGSLRRGGGTWKRKEKGQSREDALRKGKKSLDQRKGAY